MLASIRAFLWRVFHLVRGSGSESSFDKELEFHLQMETEANLHRGMTPKEARRQALIALGGLDQTREDYRRTRGVRWLNESWLDLRYAARMLAKHRGFTAVALLVLSLGIGINTAIFSIINVVFFLPLPVQSPGELVYLYHTPRRDSPPGPVMNWDCESFRERNDAFVDVAYHHAGSSRLVLNGAVVPAASEVVSANYFDLLGIKPMFGRTFLPEEDQPSSVQRAVVISHALWQRRFNSDPAIIGKDIRFDEKTYTIVGVIEPRFKGVSDPWTPTQLWITQAQSTSNYAKLNIYVWPIARLRPGVTLAKAQAILATIGRQTPTVLKYHGYPGFIVRASTEVRLPFDPQGSVVPARLAGALMAVVGIVLMIAAANIAGILMARGVNRSGEMAIRLALGSGRFRVVRQQLTESLLLSICGGTLGLLVSRFLLSIFNHYTPSQFFLDVPLDIGVLLFAGFVCAGAGVIVGIAPALQATKVNVFGMLAGGGAGVPKQVRSHIRYWIVIPQIGLSLVLLIVAGVYVKDLVKVELADLGYTIDRSVVLRFLRRQEPTPGEEAPDRALKINERAETNRILYRRLLDGIHDVPGVAAASLTDAMLPIYSYSVQPSMIFARENFVSGETGGPSAYRIFVSPDYFGSLGIPLLGGREFNESDTISSPSVAIVSDALARSLWPGGNTRGKSLAFFSPENAHRKLDWIEVVGVVGNANPILHNEKQYPLIYLPLGQKWDASANTIVVRAHGSPSQLIEGLKRAVAAADPNAEILSVATMKQLAAELLYPRRMSTAVLVFAGLTGLLLASLGIYGVVSYSVAQRIREIGIRAALGAQKIDIVKLVLREGATVTLMGSILGLLLALAATRIAASFVMAVPPIDLLTCFGSLLFIGMIILLACYIPARRAVRVDPLVALREL